MRREQPAAAVVKRVLAGLEGLALQQARPEASVPEQVDSSAQWEAQVAVRAGMGLAAVPSLWATRAPAV